VHAAFRRQIRLQGLRDLGRLHGVGVSVVNAFSSLLEVEVAREQKLYKMSFERGHPKGKLQDLGKDQQPPRHPHPLQADTEIFGAKAAFKPQRPVQDGALERPICSAA
jgi:topoisomerase-4 subunit B